MGSLDSCDIAHMRTNQPINNITPKLKKKKIHTGNGDEEENIYSSSAGSGDGLQIAAEMNSSPAGGGDGLESGG